MKKVILILMFMFAAVMLLAQPDPVAYIIGAETQTTDVTAPVLAETVLIHLNSDFVDPTLNWTPAEWDLVLDDFRIMDGEILIPGTAAEIAVNGINYISLSFDYSTYPFGPDEDDLKLHYTNFSGIDIMTEDGALQNTSTAVNIDDGINPQVFTYSIASDNENPYLGEVDDIVTFTFDANEALADYPDAPQVTFTAPEGDAFEIVTATMRGTNSKEWEAFYTIPASPTFLNSRLTVSVTFYDVHWNSGSLATVDEGSDGSYVNLRNYDPATVYVDDDWTQQSDVTAGLLWLWDAFAVIQDGIDGVADNGTVNVLAGTYAEDLTIDKTLELAGADKTTTTIKGVATGAAFPLADANIDILATGVSIHDFTIEAPTYVGGFYSSGIVVGGTNATIYNNTFLANIVSSTDDISQSIQTYNIVNMSELYIYKNTFDDVGADLAGWGYEANYINPGGTGNVNIEDNTIQGACFRGITAQRSNVTIEGNNITTTQEPVPDNWSTPGAWVGIWAYTDISDITIINNAVYGTDGEPIGGTGFNRGIRLGSTSGSTFTNLSVTGNEIYYNKNGIYSQSATGITITGNAIENNTEYGIYCAVDPDVEISINAENNWWGSGSGPDHADNTFTNPAGDPHGDTSSDFVDYVPWYDTDMTSTSFAPVQSDDGLGDAITYFSSIQTALDAAAAGATLTCQAGTFDEQISIEVSNLTLVGASNTTTIVQPSAAPAVGFSDVAIGLFGGSNVDGVTIQEILFDFNGADGLRHGQGIVISDLNGPAVENVLIDQCVIYCGLELDTPEPKCGIQTGKNADLDGLLISYNDFYGADGTYGSYGVYINPNSGTDDISIMYNNFYGKQYAGVSVESNNVNVGYNTINPALGGTYGIRVIDFVGGVNYDDIAIGYNDIDNVTYGVSVGMSTSSGSTLAAVIESNTINNCDVGIRVREDAVLDASVHYNDLSGNTSFGIKVESTSNVDATDNWWGSENGPVHDDNTFNVTDQGVDVTDLVGYVPWYNADMTGTSFSPITLSDLTDVAGYFSSFQTANDAASQDETFGCEAGTFTENFTISTPGVTIQPVGAYDTGVIIEGTQQITADNVTFDTVTFDPNGGVAVTVNSSGSVITGATFMDCTFDLADAGIGIYLGGGTPNNAVTNVEMTNNIFNGPTSMAANPWKIGGWFGTNISCEIDGITFYNNEVNKCSIPVNLVDANISNISMTYNDFNDTDGILYVWNDSGDAPLGVLSNFTFDNNDVPSTNTYGVGFDLNQIFTSDNYDGTFSIKNNSFANINGDYGFEAVSILTADPGFLLDASQCWWGYEYGPDATQNTYTPPQADIDPSAVSDNVKFAPWWRSETNISTIRGWVADTGSLLLAPVTNVTASPNTYHSSIQRGVDGATSGDVLECLAGTFDECVTIDKPLTLQGDENAEAITYLKPSFAHMDAATVKNVNDAPVLNNTPFQSVLLVDYTGVTLPTIKDFVIDGSSFNTGTPASGGYFAGIFFNDCAGTIDNLVFDDIYTLDNKGVGIVVQDDSGTDKTTEIGDCAFNTCPTGVVWLVHPNAMANIHDNTIDDSRNTIGFFSASSNTASIVDNNTLTNCQRAVVAYPFNADVKVDITNNTFDFSGIDPLTTDCDLIVGNSSALTYSYELNVDNNDFTGNWPPGTVSAKSNKIFNSVRNATGTTFTNNTFTNFKNGLWFGDFGSPYGDLTDIEIKNNTFINIDEKAINIETNLLGVGTMAINYNSFETTSDYALFNSNGTSVDAEKNWWGDVTGPDPDTEVNNPHGSAAAGGKISDDVDFIPYWATSTVKKTTEWVTTHREVVDVALDLAYSDIIQAGIDAATSNDNYFWVEVGTGGSTYTEDLTINKKLYLYEAAADATVTITGTHVVTASEVTFDNLVLDANGGIAITVNSSASTISDFTAKNCIFDLMTGHPIGILLGGYTSPNTVSNVLIDNNAFQGPADMIANPWKIGGYYGTPVSCAVDGVDFTNNTVDKCSTPINLQDANINDILIDTNTFTNTDGVIYFWGSNPAIGVLSNFVFTNNTIDNTNSYGIGIGGAAVGSPGYTDANFGAGNAVNTNWFDGIAGAYGFGAVSLLSPVTNYVLDAEDNWWGSTNGPTHSGNTFNVGFQGCEVSDNVDYVRWYNDSGMTTLFAPVIRDDGLGEVIQGYYSSIQAGIDDASNDDYIYCLFGTFTEDFSVPASVTGLTISSSAGDNGNAIIQGIATVVSTSWPLAGPNIDIWGESTTIEHFDIYAPDYVVGFYSSGICIGAIDAEIQDNRFFATSASNTDDISQCIQTYNGVDVSSTEIEDNIFTHKTTPTPGDWGYEAIYINPGPGTGSVEINDNTLGGNLLRGVTTERSNTLIDDNDISTDLVPAGAGLSTAGAYQGVNAIGNLTDVTVSDNYIGGTFLPDTGGEGFLEGIRIGSTGNIFTNFQITGNTIDGNYYGILCKAATGVTVTLNDIINNTEYGVKNDDNAEATDLSAENNWWGHSTGPSFTYNYGLGSGQGDKITTYVDYMPWLDGPSATGSTYTPTVTQILIHLNPTSPVVDTYFDIRVAAADTFGILNPEYENLVDFSQSHAALTVPDPQLLVNGFKEVTDGCISTEVFAFEDNLEIYAWEYATNNNPLYYSTESNIVIQAAAAPIAPTNVVAADVPADNGGWINLDYTMSVNDPFHSAAVAPYIDYYIVEIDWDTTAGEDWQFLATIGCYNYGGDDVTALLNAPASDVAYEYRMCAVRNAADNIARTKLGVGTLISYAPRNGPTDDASQSPWTSGGSAAAADNLPAYANIEVFLEGPYVAAGTMNTDLTGLPELAGAPANAVDLIELQLRTTTTGATVKQADGYVLSDGSVVDEDGNSSFPFFYTTDLEYYFVITHRNHLDIMSANTHTFADLPSEATTIALWEENSVYLDGFNEVEDGVYAMYSGDGNASNLVNAADAISILQNLNQVSYNSGDLNLSGLTNPADALEIINNLNTAGTVPASGGDDAIVKYKHDAGREGEDCTLEIANPTINGGLYSFDVYITRNASWTANTALGNLFGTFSSVLVFNISDNTFSNPQSSNYGSPITGATPTIWTNKVQFELVTSTLAVPTTPTLLLTVTLTIDEPTNTAGLSWQITDTALYDSSGFGYPTLELLGSDDTTLPVVLSSFTTAYIEPTPLIYWTTQSEDGNAGWNLYRGDTEEAFANGQTTQINSELIEGAGTTSEPTDYTFEDPHPVEAGLEYWYTLESVCYNGETTTYGSRSLLIPEAGSGPELPDYTALKNNYPNPFNPATEIAYAVKEGEVGTLTIFNIKGQVVESVKLPAGESTHRWEAGSNSSGVYFYKLQTDSYSKVRKMLLVK